ncbi:MAG: flagellar hook-basal body complex protein FliE [Bacillales bacterium]|jgi:flagellar hook-basal body complex protein FliE|nr:flagellar hook-basal body complex protein FliE [Bacillales bacterium]
MIQKMAMNPTQAINFKNVQANNEVKQMGSEFGTILKESINKLNESQVVSDKATNAFINGEKIDLHQVLIASEKAGVSMQLALEIRNKAIETYQEMMRMSI